MNSFNNILKSLRLSRELTQEQLSEILKVSRSAIGMYENGSRKPDFETLERIADYFNVDLDYLLGRSVKTTYIPSNGDNSSSFWSLSAAEERLISYFRELNEEEQEKILSYTDDLVLSGRYIKSSKVGMVE